MSKQPKGVETDGTVVEACRGGMFRVNLGHGHEALAKPCGKMTQNRIRVAVGDQVTVELSPYDLSRGRITYRKR